MLLYDIYSHEIIESKPIKALNFIPMTNADKKYSLVSHESVELPGTFIKKDSIIFIFSVNYFTNGLF